MIRIKGFVSHAFDDKMYEGGREAFKRAIETLVNRACGELSTDEAQVRHELFFEAQGFGRPLMVEVRNQIRECDFLIADITPDPSGEVNANVMYEIGYAMALEKRLLVIRRQTEAPPPSNIADLLAGAYAGPAAIPDLFLDEMTRRATEVIARSRRDGTRISSLLERVWFPSDTKLINLVCAREPEPSRFSDRREPNYLQMDQYEDRDALFELSTFFARRYPEAKVIRHLCDAISPDVLTENLVVLGGPGCTTGEGNAIGKELMAKLDSWVSYPAEEEDEDGLLWGERGFFETKRDEEGCVVRDWGSVLVAQNPYDETSRVVLLHGTYTAGTLAAAIAFIDSPEAVRNHVQLASLNLTDRFTGAANFEALVLAEVSSAGKVMPPKLDVSMVRLLAP